MTQQVEPMYMGRWEKFKLAILNIGAGIVVWQWSPLLGRLLVAIGFLMLLNAIIRGKERIV